MGTQGDANFRVVLQKYVIPAPLYGIPSCRDFLLQLQLHSHQAPAIDKLPEELQRKHSTDRTDTLHNNRKKVTRRGRKKGGIKARLRRGESKYRALPSVILANVRSLRNKTDELQANVFHMYEYRTASILAFTETVADWK
ncbi:hypothetical protein N1851_013787 [Merluccius polli]|uniref:Uncharacterized protein n=1 Tax=Merluccius polli TaxID=89951 RepID=A0AA47P413_MERPO|nr:hypothetical protein N1851_013787 [Merluccius polli]